MWNRRDTIKYEKPAITKENDNSKKIWKQIIKYSELTERILENKTMNKIIEGCIKWKHSYALWRKFLKTMRK